MRIEVHRASRDRDELVPVAALTTQLSDGHTIVTLFSNDKQNQGAIGNLHRDRCRIYAIQNNLPRLDRDNPLVGAL